MTASYKLTRDGLTEVVTREVGQAIRIGKDITVMVLAINPPFALIGVRAPANLRVRRSQPEKPQSTSRRPARS